MPFKLYVDSRFRQETGGNSSDSEFSVELPHPIQVRGRAYVDTILVPNTFFVIRSGENDIIYVRENSSAYRDVQIAEGQYNAITLKDALVAALNGAGKTLAGQYSVSYDPILNKLTMSLTQAETVDIYPGAYLKATPGAWPTAFNLQDSGAVTGFVGSSPITFNNLITATAANVVNTQPYHQLFLRSSLGNGYDAIGPDGSSDIVRRVTCQVPLNDIVVDQHSLPHDSVTVGIREISSLSFRLTDVFGKTVDTLGHHISFSICFLEDE